MGKGIRKALAEVLTEELTKRIAAINGRNHAIALEFVLRGVKARVNLHRGLAGSLRHRLNRNALVSRSLEGYVRRDDFAQYALAHLKYFPPGVTQL